MSICRHQGGHKEKCNSCYYDLEYRLSKVQGKLKKMAERHHDRAWNHVLSFKFCALPICVEARAAIEEETG